MSEFKNGKIFPIGEEAILVKEIHCKLVNKVQELNFYLDNNQKVNFSLSLDTFLSLHSFWLGLFVSLFERVGVVLPPTHMVWGFGPPRAPLSLIFVRK